MATEERNIENIDLAEEGKEVNGIGNEPLSEERKEEIINEITKVYKFNKSKLNNTGRLFQITLFSYFTTPV